MAVLVRILLGGVESTLSADSIERDPVSPRLLRLRGVSGLVLPESPRFVVASASLPRDSVLWYVEGEVPEIIRSGRLEAETQPAGGGS